MKNKLSYGLLVLVLLLAFGITALAGATYFQGTDNEDNAGTGSADNDMDVRLCNGNSIVPIEFNIDVATAPQPGESVQLLIRAHDVDEESGEIDYVYVNDPGLTSAVGSLAGTNDTWSISSFDVTGLVNAGNNRIDITVAPPSWCINIDWGQIVVDGGAQTVGRVTDLSASGSDWSDIQVTTVVSSSMAADFDMDLNLLDSSGNNLHIVTDSFSMAGAGETTRNNSMSTQAEPADGAQFTIQAILYDPTTLFVHHIVETTWTYQLPVDTDGDGTPDDSDIDDDNDGIPDSVEIANAPAGGDTDGDGIPDHLDLDSDNDGINDVIEGGGTDADGDGMHDGTQGELTNPPDTDGDGQPDYVDLDSDNDSISDLVEGGSGATDADDDGVADGPDADGDGIVDDADDNDGLFGEDADGGPQDTDGDGDPDYVDPDSDNDGTDDVDEAGNGDLDTDDDGQVDDDTDSDGDGIPDFVDDDDATFGGLGEPDTDTDGDGTPDYVDNDSDNDGIPDSVEIANAPAGGDTDGDGIPDHLDLDSDNDGINDVHEGGGTDADGDGMHDGTQGELTDPPDTDGDGQPDYVDLDSDNDSVSDLVEGGSGATDADDDGVADGPDADGDGIVDDADDNDGLFGEDADGGPQDTDGDGDPDYVDPDSNDDGIDDVDEAGNSDLDADDDGQVDDDTDSDGDGIPDVVDNDDATFGGLGQNAPPTVQDDIYTVPEGVASTLDVLANDSDPEGDTLILTQVSAPQHGTAQIGGAVGIQGDILVYTPTAGYLGTDTFTYTVSDGSLENTASVTLTVSPVADLAVEQQIRATLTGYDFLIVARNLGARPAPGAVVSDTFPAFLSNISWTCVGAGGASCSASGSGHVLSDTLDSFPAGGVVTYTVRSSGNEIALNTVTITPPEDVFDLYMDNNRDTRPTSYRIILPVMFKNSTGTPPTR